MGSRRNPDAFYGWVTPRVVLDCLLPLGPIDLDPATTEDNPTGATHFFTPETNGLTRSWRRYGFVYVNPEYRPEWYGKILEEARRGTEMVVNVMAKPGTHYFQDLADLATAICFWLGRIDYIDPRPPDPARKNNGSNFESAFLYFGHRAPLFRQGFKEHGWIIPGGVG